MVVAGDADPGAVEAACTAAGFVLRPAARGGPGADGHLRRDALVALVLAGPVVVLAMTHVPGSGPVQVLLAGLAALGPGAGILATGIRDLLRGRPAMDSLVALGVLAALGLGGWQAAAGEAHTAAEAAAVVIAAVCLGRWLEGRARTALAGALTDLDRLVPATARLADGQTVPVADLHPGDLVVVPPGETVPVDGPVVTGVSTLSAPWLDGEPVPRAVGPGAPAR
jgi:Cu+-exporting ATPase